MDIEEVKINVAAICEDFAGGFPYESSSIEAETWDDLADELRDLASLAASGANRIAAYAGIAQRKANQEG